MSDLKIVVLISTDLSDIYFANQLIDKTNVVGVFVEQQCKQTFLFHKIKKFIVSCLNPLCLLKKIREIFIHQYYLNKARQIAIKGFGRDNIILNRTKKCQVVYTNVGQTINSSQYVDAIKALQPDIIAVCGASILKEEIIAVPKKGVFNLHSGLSQKYRGTWTTLWAIYNEEPEYVAYTVHYVNSGIDLGNIVCQGRPEISEKDNQESLYVKVVKLGTQTMIKIINDLKNKDVISYPLPKKGTLYLNSMVTTLIIRKTWQKVRQGLIRTYVKKPLNVELIGVHY